MANVRNQKVLIAPEGLKHTAVDAEVVARPYNALKITTGGASTTLIDTTRIGDGDDFWNGCFMFAVSGTNGAAGLSRKVTDFVSSTGTFTISSGFTTSVATNDIMKLGHYVNANEIEFGPELNQIVRNTLGKRIGQSVPISILQGATAKIVAHMTGAAAYPAVNVAVTPPPMHDLYKAVMGKAPGPTANNFDLPNITSGVASTVDIVNITTTKHTNFSFGNAFMVEDVNVAGNILDEVRWVTGKTAGTPDLLYAKPSFTAAQTTNGKRVYAGTTYGLLDIGHPRVTVEIYQPDSVSTGQVVILHNCLANFELGADVANLMTASFDLLGSALVVQTMGSTHFSRSISVSGVDEEPSWGPFQTIKAELGFRTTPPATGTGAAYSTTLRDITKISLKSGNTLAKKLSFNASTGVASTFVSGRNPSLSLSAYFEGGFADFADLTGVVLKDVQLQIGGDLEESAVQKRNVFALRVPYAVITDYKAGDQDGIITLDLELQVAIDKSEGFEDPNLGTFAHNTPPIDDDYRIAFF